MLKHLSIKNYAIIDSLHISFHPRLNIITGETGAGKSIIIGALNMILGKRADGNVLRNKESKGIIEGTFNIGNYQLEELFTALDLDYEEDTILRREIKPNGKSRAFINDSPVTLDRLKELTGKLVDLHAQHDTAAILKNQFYIDVLDQLADQQAKVAQYKIDWMRWREKSKHLKSLKEQIATQIADWDYLNFQYRELDDLQLTSSDGSALEEELKILENAGSIVEQLNSASQLLETGDMNIQDLMSQVAQHVSAVADFSGDLKALSDRVHQSILEISDISNELSHSAESTTMDEQRHQEVESRYNLIQRLLQKHRCQDVEELIQLHETLGKKLKALSTSETDIKGLENDLELLTVKLKNDALEISVARKKQCKQFTGAILKVLENIGMPYARLELQHSTHTEGEMKLLGIDNFSLEFSANKGIPLQPLKQVASGGERSRLMLAIKSVMASYMQLPTMIFDEIDTGISGEVAGKVGDELRKLANSHQVISISHLPQIAAQATAHYFVYKDHSESTTSTNIKLLDREEHVLEIAKMLSGDQPGQAAITNAKELIKL